MRRRLQTDRNLLKKILAEWKEEQSAIVSYLAMLNTDFLAGERAGSYALCSGPSVCAWAFIRLACWTGTGALDAVGVGNAVAGSPDVGIFDLLSPILNVWGGFIERNPDLSGKFL